MGTTKRVHFPCPNCRAKLGARSDKAGQSYACPSCGTAVKVPHPSRKPKPTRESQSLTVVCGGCGAEQRVRAVLDNRRFECNSCGVLLELPAVQQNMSPPKTRKNDSAKKDKLGGSLPDLLDEELNSPSLFDELDEQSDLSESTLSDDAYGVRDEPPSAHSVQLRVKKKIPEDTGDVSVQCRRCGEFTSFHVTSDDPEHQGRCSTCNTLLLVPTLAYANYEKEKNRPNIFYIVFIVACVAIILAAVGKALFSPLPPTEQAERFVERYIVNLLADSKDEASALRREADPIAVEQWGENLYLVGGFYRGMIITRSSGSHTMYLVKLTEKDGESYAEIVTMMLDLDVEDEREKYKNVKVLKQWYYGPRKAP